MPRKRAEYLVDFYEKPTPTFRELESAASRCFSQDLAEICFNALEVSKRSFRKNPNAGEEWLSDQLELWMQSCFSCMEKWFKAYLSLSNQGCPDMPFAGCVLWTNAKVEEITWEGLGFDIVEGNRYWTGWARLVEGDRVSERDTGTFGVTLVIRFLGHLQRLSDQAVLTGAQSTHAENSILDVRRSTTVVRGRNVTPRQKTQAARDRLIWEIAPTGVKGKE
jgi:hypothetical protein